MLGVNPRQVTGKAAGLPVGAEEFIGAAEPWPGAGAVLNWLCRTELPILPPSTTPGTALLHPAQGTGKLKPHGRAAVGSREHQDGNWGRRLDAGWLCVPSQPTNTCWI